MTGDGKRREAARIFRDLVDEWYEDACMQVSVIRWKVEEITGEKFGDLGEMWRCLADIVDPDGAMNGDAR